MPGPLDGPKRPDVALGRVPAPRLYVYFDAIVRQGSIRAAAEQLRIASSALNRRLLDLEQEVGTVLFDRLQTGVRLTAAGEIFAAHVRRTLGEVQQVGQRLQELRGTVRGHVAISSAESAAIDLLPHAIASFQQEHQGVRFTVSVGAPRVLLHDLLDDRADLILTHEEPAHPDVAVVAAARKSFCALMRPGHPLSARASLLMHECQGFPVVLAEEHLAARTLVETTLANSALRISPVLVTNLFEVMKRYIRHTDAISFQFHFSPRSDPDAGGLVAVPLADPNLAQARLILAIRRGRALAPFTLAVCERLAALIGDEAR